MRKALLTAVLAGLIVLPVLGQPGRGPGGGMFGMGGGNMLLANQDVQKALKLTDDQKESLKKASTNMREAMQKAREDMDREGFTKAMTAYNEEMTKVRDALTATQKKRLLGIEIQQAERSSQPRIFTRAEVQKALKLTDKQKETVKELIDEMDKDLKELMEDAKGDREKGMAAFKKMATMGKERYTKITKQLTADQKAAWKELQGEKVELRFGGPGGGFGPGGGKDRPKREPKKKDDA